MKTVSTEIAYPVGNISLTGNLIIPEGSASIVIFSHGSGSSRFSPRNRYVAEVLNKKNISTLLIDLLTPEEDTVYENRFNIDLLTTRLVAITEYVHHAHQTRNMKIGYFGASTGAASALKAASRLDPLIDAIVSRGGRTDLADDELPDIKAPTLLLVGGLDTPVILLNQKSYKLLQCKKELHIIKDATHLFEEKGKLEEVAKLAEKWFTCYFADGISKKQKKIHDDL